VCVDWCLRRTHLPHDTLYACRAWCESSIELPSIELPCLEAPCTLREHVFRYVVWCWCQYWLFRDCCWCVRRQMVMQDLDEYEQTAVHLAQNPTELAQWYPPLTICRCSWHKICINTNEIDVMFCVVGVCLCMQMCWNRRSRLAAKRLSAPLFDTERWVRSFENGLHQVSAQFVLP